MMKYLNTLLAVILCTGCIARAEDTVHQKETIQFDGQTLIFAFQGTNPSENFKEYIPAGEKLESWTKLASIREYPALKDAKAVATNLLHVLARQNPQAPSKMFENPKTGDVMVDFVTWMPDNSFAEFNVFKYSKRQGGGLVAQQYALRAYKDITNFLKGLGPVRKRLVDLMATEGLHLNK